MIALLLLLQTANGLPLASVVGYVDGKNPARYHYEIRNERKDAEVVAVLIGQRNEVCQLQSKPLGWTTEQGLPASSAKTPKGWEAAAYADQSANRDSWCVEFSVIQSTRNAPAVRGGTSLKDFEVTAIAPDQAYLSTYLAYFDDGRTIAGNIVRRR